MSPTVDRRKFLTYTGVAGAAAGTAWIAPSVLGSSTAFADGSGTLSYAPMNFYKYTNSQNTYLQSTACSPGYVQANLNGAANRGTVAYTYTPSTAQVCFTVTLASGPDIGTRTVYLLTSDGTSCLGVIDTGVWGANTSSTYTACATVPSGTTQVTITAEVSGGGGTAVYLTDHLTLLP